MPPRPLFRRALAVAAAGALGALALPAAALAAEQCTTNGISYDPDVLTWDGFFRANPRYSDAIVPFAAGGPGRSTGKNTTANIDRYFQAVTRQVNSDPEMSRRVAIKEVMFGKSELGNRGVNGRDLGFWVVSTPQNIANFEADGAFWADVRDGRRSEAEGLAAIRTRPAIGWVTATPHGNEPAAGEAITRQLYELVARTDCANLRRLQNLDIVLDPVRNPDGRDNNVRTTSWGFDPNRDFGVRNYVENGSFLPYIARYPGLFFIDAHQQGAGYFFPPNEDPVHHEISNFALDFIQNRIGPKLQQTFNDQSSQYQNYNSYDLFTPEYGDTVPSLLMGAAGMTYEKGSDENYGKQVYDHYLAIDTTINLTSNGKVNLTRKWVEQWEEARQQGEACSLQENKLVSPLHETILQQPHGQVCGYFYRPDLHEGDVARLMRALREVGVHVYRLDQDTATGGIHTYGMPVGEGRQGVLPKGTLWIPMSQPQKHWLQAILGEDPFIPYNYYYDVVTWSFGMQRGLAGDGHLTVPLPSGTPMTEVDSVNFGSVPSSAAVYAFDTDSMEALALTVELLDKGVNVYRATSAFDADGVHFDSGAALVDGASLASSGADLAALASRRSIPVTGLSGYPVARKQLTVPKIGVFTGTSYVPTNPLNVDVAAVNNGTATHSTSGPANDGQCQTGAEYRGGPSGGAFCEAMFVLTQKDRLPASLFVPVTPADLAAGVLRSGGFTAFVNGSFATAAGAESTRLQEWINEGGIYLGVNTAGLTSARNAGATSLNTAAIAGLNTPGSTFDATFDTTNPVAWGFDEGGWIYRDSTGNPVFDRSTLGSATAAVSFGPLNSTDARGQPAMRSYGYSVNALGAGQLTGRPAVVDQPFGAGRAIFFGFNPFFRSWKEQDERLVLNAVLYPLGAELPAAAATRSTAQPAATEVKPLSTPLAAKKLPAVASRPAKKVAAPDKHVIIRVARKQGGKLRAAVKAAKLSKSLRKRVSYKVTKTTVTLTVKNVRTADAHARQMWVARIMGGLKKRGVTAKMAQL